MPDRIPTQLRRLPAPDLEPCPCCGNPSSAGGPYLRYHYGSWQVLCDICFASAAVDVERDPAIASWNTLSRANMPATPRPRYRYFSYEGLPGKATEYRFRINNAHPGDARCPLGADTDHRYPREWTRMSIQSLSDFVSDYSGKLFEKMTELFPSPDDP